MTLVYCRTVPVYKFIAVLLVMCVDHDFYVLSDSSCAQVYFCVISDVLSDSSCVQVYFCVISECVDHDSGVLSESSCVQVYFCVISDAC